MRSLIYDLVKNIVPLDALEEKHQSDALDWIQSGAGLFRVQKPSTPPKHLVAYFVLVDLRERLMLLVDHKKAHLWLPSEGHVEPDEHPRDTANRELEEELGVHLPLLQVNPLFLTVTETVGLTAGHTDVSLWYVYQAESSMRFDYDRSEFTEVRWFPISDLPLERSDPHMSRFRRKLLASFPV